jgi:hypothetical protein
VLPPQRLVNVLSVPDLGAGDRTTLFHGLLSGGVGVAPTLVFPDRTTSITVTGTTATTITFTNTGTGTETANFRCERGWQPEVDAFSVTPMFWQGSATGNVAPLSIAPRTLAGTAGWTEYEEFEAGAPNGLDALVGATSLSLQYAAKPLPQQHMAVRNGRIMRLNRDYTLTSNVLVLTRVLMHGDVLLVYYNKADA